MSLKWNNVLVTVLMIGSSMTMSAQSQKAGTDKNIQRILGTWKIQKIFSGKTEVAKNPTSGQWIEFRPDGKYVQVLASADSGSYRLNENQSVLYLESQLHADPVKHEAKKIVEWTIAFDNETLTMQQLEKEKKPHADIMKYVYTRIADAPKARNN